MTGGASRGGPKRRTPGFVAWRANPGRLPKGSAPQHMAVRDCAGRSSAASCAIGTAVTLEATTIAGKEASHENAEDDADDVHHSGSCRSSLGSHNLCGTWEPRRCAPDVPPLRQDVWRMG